MCLRFTILSDDDEDDDCESDLDWWDWECEVESSSSNGEVKKIVKRSQSVRCTLHTRIGGIYSRIGHFAASRRRRKLAI